MKYFKHLVRSGDDPDIGLIKTRFGDKGYYWFFRTLEIMADEFDILNPGVVTCDIKWLLGRYYPPIFSLNRRYLFRKFLNLCHKLDRINYSINKNLITLKCNKLKELTDEYTEKLLAQKSGQTPDNIPSDVGTNSRIYNKNKNKNIYNKNYIYTDDDMFLVGKMLEHLERNNPKLTILNKMDKDQRGKQRWANTFRIIREQDGRTIEEIKDIIDKAMLDNFWRTVILSPENLRKQWDRLILLPLRKEGNEKKTDWAKEAAEKFKE